MILFAGLSPAWQQVVEVDAFAVGEVVRARSVDWCAGGKAVNAALAAQRFETHVRLLTTAGGANGEKLREALTIAGVEGDWVPTGLETRVCTTIIDREGGSTTEIVDNAPPISAEVLDSFRASFRQALGSADAIALAGSLSPGAPDSLYAELVETAQVPVVIDASGAALAGALSSRPFLVKLNRSELAATLGCDLRQDSALEDASAEVLSRGAAWIVVTDGANDTHVASGDGTWKIRPPKVEVVNAIGCGDAMTGAIASLLGQGRDPIDAIRVGVAAAAANLERVGMLDFDGCRADEIAETVEVTRL